MDEKEAEKEVVEEPSKGVSGGKWRSLPSPLGTESKLNLAESAFRNLPCV